MTIRHSEPESSYQINFLNLQQRAELLAQGQTFIVQEQTRPLKQQTVFTPRIIRLVDQLQTAYATQAAAERQRTIAADKLKQLSKKAVMVVSQMWKSVTGKYENDPSEATRWGFKLKPRTRNVLRPKNVPERLALMNAYIAKEESRPEEERFRIPELAEVIELRDLITANMLAYQDGQNQQENSFEAIKKLTKALSNCLQGAAIQILGVDFDFDLSTQMQNWGYDITLKRKSSSSKETGSEAAPTNDAPSAEAPASTNGTDGAANGAGDGA